MRGSLEGGVKVFGYRMQQRQLFQGDAGEYKCAAEVLEGSVVEIHLFNPITLLPVK